MVPSIKPPENVFMKTMKSKQEMRNANVSTDTYTSFTPKH